MADSGQTFSFFDRSFVAVALFVGLFALAWRYMPTEHPLDDYNLVEKLKWESCADVYISGASEAAFGFDPEIIEGELPNYRVVNGALLELEYIEEYIDRVEAALDPKSPAPVVVIALNIFTGHDRALHFGSAKVRRTVARIDEPISVALPPEHRKANRLSRRSLCAFLFNACPWRTHMDIGHAGQVVVDGRTFLPEAYRTSAWRMLSDIGFEYRDENLKPLEQGIRRFVASGVRTYYVKIIPAPFVEETARRRGFRWEKVEQIAQGAGAVRLDLTTDYETIDGVHPTVRGARSLSVDLGRKLAEKLPAQDKPVSSTRCQWPTPNEGAKGE